MFLSEDGVTSDIERPMLVFVNCLIDPLVTRRAKLGNRHIRRRIGRYHPLPLHRLS